VTNSEFGSETPGPDHEENRTAEETEIRHTSLEAPPVRTEISGTATLSDGQATVELPNHFAAVTSDTESVDVQVTPRSTDTACLAVTDATEQAITVEDVDGTGDYQFTYTVKGVRSGYEDRQVVRPAEDRRERSREEERQATAEEGSPPDDGGIPPEREPRPPRDPPEPPEGEDIATGD